MTRTPLEYRNKRNKSHYKWLLWIFSFLDRHQFRSYQTRHFNFQRRGSAKSKRSGESILGKSLESRWLPEGLTSLNEMQCDTVNITRHITPQKVRDSSLELQIFTKLHQPFPTSLPVSIKTVSSAFLPLTQTAFRDGV